MSAPALPSKSPHRRWTPAAAIAAASHVVKPPRTTGRKPRFKSGPVPVATLKHSRRSSASPPISDAASTRASLLDNDRLLRLDEVLTLLPIGRSTFLRRVKDGIYPPSIRLGPRSVAWRLSDIRALIRGLETAAG